MKLKRMVSAIAALAVSVTTFAGMAVTANAFETITINYDDQPADYGWSGSDATYSYVASGDGYAFKAKLNSRANGRGHQNNFGNLPAGTSYVLDFDLNIGEYATTNSRSQTVDFAVKGVDFAYISKNVNYGAASGYLFKLDHVTRETSMTVSGTDVKVNMNENYHYKIAVDASGYTVENAQTPKVYLTLTDGSGETVCDKKLVASSGTGGLTGLYCLLGRYDTAMTIDNITVRDITDEDLPSIPSYKVTIKYQDLEGNTVAQDKETSVLQGESFTPEYETIIVKDNMEYTYASGADTITNITAPQEIIVKYSGRVLEDRNVKLTQRYGDKSQENSVTVKEYGDYNIPYSKYIIYNDTLYSISEKAASDAYFAYKGTLGVSGLEKEIVYNEEIGTTPYTFIEAESLGTPATGNNADIRCSNGAGFNPGEEKVKVIDLPAGTYTIEAALWGTSGNTFKLVDDSENVYFENSTTGSVAVKTTETINLDKDITLYLEGYNSDGNLGASSNSMIDYILIRGTATTPIPATVLAGHVKDYNDEAATDAATGASLWNAIITGNGTGFNKIRVDGVIKSGEDTVKTASPVTEDLGTTITTGSAYIYIAVNQAVSKLEGGQTMEVTVTPVSE